MRVGNVVDDNFGYARQSLQKYNNLPARVDLIIRFNVIIINVFRERKVCNLQRLYIKKKKLLCTYQCYIYQNYIQVNTTRIDFQNIIMRIY